MQDINEANHKSLMFRFMKRTDSSAVIAFVGVFLFFAIASGDQFLTMNNMFGVTRNAALFIFVAIGQAMVVVIGGMNVGLGSIGGLATITTGICLQNLGLPDAVAVVFALLVGALAGLFNGFIINKLKINAFVATLATSFVYTGLVNGICQGQPYSEIPDSFSLIGRAEFLGFPVLLWFAIIVLVILGCFFRYSILGRKILATGGNREAARFSGIRVERITLLMHIMSGIFAALAGILWVSRVGSASPGIGADWMLVSFAVAIIGGTGLNGGTISSWGILCSGLLYAFIKNGLVMVSVDQYFEQAFFGAIILVAVMVESARSRAIQSIELRELKK